MYLKKWREEGAGRDPNALADADQTFKSFAKLAADLPNSDLSTISRAFTHFLALANAAESHHRSRLIRDSITKQQIMGGDPKNEAGALSSKRDSCGGALPHLINELNIDPKKVWETLSTQTVELVLTAHPTEVNRRTLLDKHKKIQEVLTKADEKRASGPMSPYNKALLDNALHREITSIWQSDEVSRIKPTVQSEAEKGTLVIESVLWEAVPSFLRKLDATMKSTLGGKDMGLPLDSAPIKFATWMGGDRDGNPNVTANVTREVCLTNRAKAARLFGADVTSLSAVLSITNCSDELRARVSSDAREPYREFLKPIIDKLKRTQSWAEDGLSRLQNKEGSKSAYEHSQSAGDIYLSSAELMDDLMLVFTSLCETGNAVEADGILTDIIRNVSAFGLTLVPLDIRQESDRHEEALDCITRHLGLGSYAQWDEETKLSWLQRELSSNRPLVRPGEWNENKNIFVPTAIETLEAFQMISEQHEESLGAYVISQATSASDVLAVLLLQRDAGVKKPLRVVPLFETLDDLKGAAATMECLFNISAYKGSIGGKQEVMIGYSDSAKDAGRLAASWAQYETQEELAQVAAKHNIDLAFFHGKGGTVGRGGNPATFDAILAHGPNTINAKFRVTEQGEMINQNFGFKDRAERTMNIYTAAVVSEHHTHRPTPTPEWRDMMATLSRISCDAYRDIVREDKRFVPYFRSATPEQEFAELKIGSRPAKRKASGGVESLRAIPWIFAWTQTRLNLPTWLGVGEAIREVLDGPDADKLRSMYSEWTSFSTTVDLVEMVLAKSEPSIAAHYDTMLVHEEDAVSLGKHVRKIHANTESTILDLTGHTMLGEDNAVLQRQLQVRNPYVDCLNILQAETLLRLRNCNDTEEEKILKDALLTTITGIANGMGNTG
uniref:phosphoenolpyruvate carboxylase n=1 Tax=Ditylum brightwellii TaxID=49249 RepID=A0A7S4R6G9_9STRA